MRVLHAVASLDESYGGPAFSVPSLANGLANLGAENWFLSTSRPDAYSRNYLMDPHRRRWIETSRSRIMQSAYYSSETSSVARSILKREGIEIVHLHSIWNHLSWTVASVAHSMKIPFVISPRSELMLQSRKRSRLKKALASGLFVSRMLRSSSGFHVTDEIEYDQLPAEYSQNVVVSPNGIDLSIGDNLPDKTEAKLSLGLDPERRYILFLSRLHERKNPDLLIKAFNALDLSEQKWGLVMAGPADDQATNRKIENELKVRPAARVHFTGQVGYEAKRNCYAAADLFVLPTDFENFGNAIAEALACRIPVITTTGTPWGQLPGLNAGWITEPNIHGLTESLREACTKTGSELAAIGSAGRLVVSEFSWDRAAQKVYAFYEGSTKK